MTDSAGNAIGTAAAPASSAGMGLGGSLLAGAAALHGGYNLVNNFGNQSALSGALSGAEAGAGIGSFVPGVGTAIGAGVGALAGLASSAFHTTGKDKDQQLRDKVRAGLKQGGVIDNNYDLKLSGGATANIGIDGHGKPYNLDEKNPLAIEARGYAIPLARLVSGGDKKILEDFSGYFANAGAGHAGTDSATLKKDMQAIGDKLGGVDKIKGGLQALYDQKKITKDELDTSLNGLDSFYGIGAYGPKQDGSSKPAKSSPKPGVKAAAAPIAQPNFDYSQNYLPSFGAPPSAPGANQQAQPNPMNYILKIINNRQGAR